jgi:hypothetical protein
MSAIPALLPSSGTTAFNPSFGDFIIESYSRIQVRPPSLTADHFVQARLSGNLLFSEWSNIGMPLLWQIKLLQIPLAPGVKDYTLPANVVAPLDAYIRQYQTGNAQNFAPVFIADSGSQSCQVTQTAHSLAAGQMVWYPAPISAGGVIVEGPYIVTSVVDFNNYEITLPMAADGSNTAVLPIFTTAVDSPDIGVHLPAHGLSGGQTFYINIPTLVGGIQLSGGLTVISVTGPDDFVALNGQSAFAIDTETMNGGMAQTQTEDYNTPPIDFIMYPISRTEYASQANKFQQYRPTTFWFDRQVQPQIHFWNDPDNAFPYVFNLYVMQQPDDAVVGGGVGVGVPFRWFDAFAAGLAVRLALKFPPPPASGVTLPMLKLEYDDPVGGNGALQKALREDIERVPLYLLGSFSGYYR